jgi:hypothetical protein
MACAFARESKNRTEWKQDGNSNASFVVQKGMRNLSHIARSLDLDVRSAESRA